MEVGVRVGIDNAKTAFPITDMLNNRCERAHNVGDSFSSADTRKQQLELELSSKASFAEKRRLFETQLKSHDRSSVNGTTITSSVQLPKSSLVKNSIKNVIAAAPPPPKPKRTFAQDHYFSLSQINSGSVNSVEKVLAVGKLKPTIFQSVSIDNAQPPQLSIACQSGLTVARQTELTQKFDGYSQPVLKRWNTTAQQTTSACSPVTVSSKPSTKKLPIPPIDSSSSSKSTVCNNGKPPIVAHRVVGVSTPTPPIKRPKYFQLSHEYEQIFSANRTPATYQHNLTRRSASLENVYASPIVVNSAKSASSAAAETKQSLYYCSAPIPSNSPTSQRRKLSLKTVVNSNGDVATPVSSRATHKLKLSLRNVIIRDSRIFYRDGLQRRQLSGESSSKFFDNDNGEGEEDSEQEDNVSLTSTNSVKDREVERRVTRAKVVRRQTLMHYDQQETAFKCRKSPQLFEMAALIELRPNDSSNPFFSGSKFVPTVSYKFPPTLASHSDVLMSSLPCLCYPDISRACPKAPNDFKDEQFVITITDQTGDRKFAYCYRYVPVWVSSDDDEQLTDLPSLPQVLCVVTPVQAFQFYSDFVKEAASRAKSNLIALNEFLRVSFGKATPLVGGRLTIGCLGKEVTLTNRTSSTGGHGLNMLLDLLKNVDIMLLLFASLLSERRVLIVGGNVPMVSKVVQASAAMLSPFEWPHTLIPVIPDSYVQLCFSPTPYLIGVLRSNLPHLKSLIVERNEEGEDEDYMFIYDLDYGILKDHDSNVCTSLKSPTTSTDEAHRFLPTRVARNLRKQLSKMASSSVVGSSPTTLDAKVAEVFLLTFVELIGHYGEFLVTQQDGNVVFQKQNFVQSVASKSHKMFLKWFVETGMFQIWMRKRLESVMSGSKTLESVFDKKISEMRNNASTSSDLFGAAKRWASFLKMKR